MTFFVYVFIFASIATLNRYKFASSLIFGVMIGMSYQLGHADFISYTDLYKGFQSDGAEQISRDVITGHYEPIYMLLAIGGSRLGLDFYDFRLLVYTAAFYLFLGGLDKSSVKDKRTFVFLFLVLTSFTHLFSVDRQALALMLALASIYSASSILKYLPLGFHFSSMIILGPITLFQRRTITIFLTCALALLATVYADKYVYLLENPNLDGGSITSIMVVLWLVLELYLNKKKSWVDDSKIRVLLTTCIGLGLVTLAFPAVFYRLKAFFILCALVSCFTRDPIVAVTNNLRFCLVFFIGCFVCFFYVWGDPLAFDPYQNKLLLDVYNYEDKRDEWWQIFLN